MTRPDDLIRLSSSGGALELGVARDPRLGHGEEPIMELRAITHHEGSQSHEEFLRAYLLPHEIPTVLGLLDAASPTGSIDLIYPEDAPNWWVRLTRREPGEDAPQLELRRLDPESGVAEAEALALSQPEADQLARRLPKVLAQYTGELEQREA